MPRGNTILFALVFFYVSYRIIQPWFVEEPKKDQSNKPAQTSSSQSASSDRYIAERLAEGMPKLYAWQRLLHLYESGAEQAYLAYLNEWIENNPEQLFDKAFRNYQGAELSQIQQDFISDFTRYFDLQAEPQLDLWFDGQMSSPVKLAVCKSLYTHHTSMLEAWILNNHQQTGVINQCMDYLFALDFEQAERWYQATNGLKKLELVQAKYQALTQQKAQINNP